MSKRLTIEEMQTVATFKKGKCLSEKYINDRTKLKWQCKAGHVWEAVPRDIKRDHWCPKCAGNQKLTVKEMQELAKRRGGICLSKKYINAYTKLKWQCKDRHIWESAPKEIKSGCWCPICSPSISERICRKYFEIILNKKFPKVKLTWLINSRGHKMELDGYCEELRLAFEYQGEQHYEKHQHFHKKISFEQRKEDDERKRKLCKENGIILIEIPYTIDFENVGTHIIKECKKRNIQVPEITKKLDYKLFNISSPEKLKEMQQIATSRDGKCLSGIYINNHTNLKWICNKGHMWNATPTNIKSGHWCRQCAALKRRKSIPKHTLIQQKLVFENKNKIKIPPPLATATV